MFEINRKMKEFTEKNEYFTENDVKVIALIFTLY